MSEAIQYDYEIVGVDQPAKSMEIKYTSATGHVVHVGVPIPGPDEDLEAHIHAYSPVIWWAEQDRPVRTDIVPGAIGSGTGYPFGRPLTAEEEEALRAIELQAMRMSPGALLPALEVLVDTLFAPQVRADTLPQAKAEAIKPLFKRYRVGVAYAAEDVFEYQRVLYEVISPHTSQADWPPDTTASLYKAHYLPGVIPDWTMPTGEHDAPNTGDECRHNSKCWRSLIDANTTEPGTDDRWWEEFACPEV